jgi:hypothetical protein
MNSAGLNLVQVGPERTECDTPGVNFGLCREIYPNLGCSVKISLSRSRMSLIIQIIHFTFHRIQNYSISTNTEFEAC